MKRILLITLFILMTSMQVFAQNERGGRFKALKTAFITNALDLSSKEAEKFWPIYNEYDKTIHLVKTQKTRQLTREILAAGGIDNLSNDEASNITQQFIKIEFDVANAKRELLRKLSPVIPAKKIIKLFKAEQDFNKELLKKLRERRQENIKKRN